MFAKTKIRTTAVSFAIGGVFAVSVYWLDGIAAAITIPGWFYEPLQSNLRLLLFLWDLAVRVPTYLIAAIVPAFLMRRYASNQPVRWTFVALIPVVAYVIYGAIEQFFGPYLEAYVSAIRDQWYGYITIAIGLLMLPALVYVIEHFGSSSNHPLQGDLGAGSDAPCGS